MSTSVITNAVPEVANYIGSNPFTKILPSRYNGMIHNFGLLNPLANLPQPKSPISHARA